ncbi:MAG: class I SAM-dependent methyltransferase [Candidatus Schekmanbacteria bacterium]|nr:class I SAM-dependent methyltransferase [Candidatus Schekmanbacteria bacterium]
MNIQHFRTILELVREADAHGILKQTAGLTGFSGAKLLGALQRLARYQAELNGGCYLEIGVFQGLTLISVASAIPAAPAYGIDNFASHDPEKRNLRIVESRAAANRLDNVTIINEDYEDALEELGRHVGDRRIGLLFIDGPHDYRSQLMCLMLARQYLSDTAVIVVDDCNYRHVRLASRDFLATHEDLKLVCEYYAPCHPDNMKEADQRAAKDGWWNGVHILAKDPLGVLDKSLPPTLRSRTLYVNDHVVHSSKYAFLAIELVRFASLLLSLRLKPAAFALVDLLRGLFHPPAELVGEFPLANTFSRDLPGCRINPSLRGDVP